MSSTPTARPKRRPIALAVTALLLAPLLAAGCASSSGPSGPVPAGSLAVVVEGLPPGAAADVSLTWPSTAVSALAGSAVLSGAPGGGYRVQAAPVMAGGTAYYPSVTDAGFELVEGQSLRIGVAYAPFPFTGGWVRELARLDAAMASFMAARQVPAGVVGVTHGGRLVFWRGYGWQDEARTVPMGPDGMFRLASLSKPLTWRLIEDLVGAGLLSRSEPVYPYLGLEPLPGATVDPRVYQITVQHLLDHRSGWDYQQGASRDYASANRLVAQAMGIPGPATKHDLARYMMGEPLQHAPGAVAAYNNFNYVLLGIVAERATGLGYEAALHQRVLDPIGATEIEVGRTLRGLQGPREPYYSDPDTGCSVMDTAGCAFLPVTYGGGMYLEAVDAAGGLVGSTRSLLRFMNAWFLYGPAVAPGWSWDYTWYGSYPGTSTMLRQRSDGTNLVVLVDQRRDLSGLSYELAPVFDPVVEAIEAWPAGEAP